MSDRIQDEVDRVLADILAERPLPDLLRGMIAYHLGWVDGDLRDLPPHDQQRFGGKKMRAVLCALACEAAGGPPEAAYPVAAAVELVQNFSLVHDDIEDGDRERRHRPTVWVQWGVPQAINTGSAMQAMVNAAVLRASAPAATVLDVFRALTAAMVEMTEGQHLDIAFQDQDDVTVEQYEDMASRKTGALMEAAAYTGARLATDDAARLDAWRRFGRAFGQAFQARDDLLGVTGIPSLTGKPVGNDIRARKKSLPVLHALASGTPDERALIRAVFAAENITDADVQRVTAVMERSGALAATREAVERATAEAMEAFAATGARGPAAEGIREMALKAVGREQ